MQMLSVESIDREIAERDARYQRERQELESGYKQDRDILMKARDYALRSSLHEADRPFPAGTLPNGTIRPTRKGQKTDRQNIREFLAGFTGTFTIPEVMAAAQRHPDSAAAKFSQNLWSSAIFWLVRNRFLETVEPRRGNKPGRYRVIVSPAEMVTPKRLIHKTKSPVKGAVLEAIKRLTAERFSKKDLIEAVRKADPERDPEVIGAVLYRLASRNIGARIAEHNREGNVYERL